MSNISFSRYINVISGVGAGASVAQRQLILRLMTQNTAMPPGIVLQFANATSVSAYFGANSEEYARALAYFGFISKSIQSPQLISFGRWVNTAIAPNIVGDSVAKTLSQWASISAGTMTITDGVAAINVTGINTASATSLSQVASILQTQIRAAGAAATDAQLTSATVTYNTNTNQFVLVGSVTGSGTLTCAATALTTDVSVITGWSTGGAVYAPGQAADGPDVAITKSAGISNNFGSFAYVGATLTNTQITAVATWNNTQNNMFMYSVPVLQSNLATLYALVSGFSGTCLNVLSATVANDYVEQSPCEILAATNFNATNGVQGYMYYQFPNRSVTVSDDNTANTVDASRGNYIGQTQIAGQALAFYQRGVLCGGSTAAVDINTYANEMWMKSYISSLLMSTFLNSPRIPANQVGAAQLTAVIQTAVNQGKTNGTISAGKTLSIVQQQYITTVTGDPNAWRQVSTLGYWLNVTFTSFVNTNNNLTEWQANYTLIYSKDDLIRSVQGSDILI